MKVLLLNGSTRVNGCTFTALKEAEIVLNNNGIETEILQLGSHPIRDCMACGKCVELKKCIINDDVVNKLIEKAHECDGFIFGSPVYYAHPSGQILSVLDRAFYAGSRAFKGKPACAIASARRAGTTASIDVLNKYFGINSMPIATSSYWNMVHGKTPEEVKQDLEGMQTVRNLANNLAYLIKCIDAGKKAGIDHPVNEKKIYTNFIR